MKRRYLANCHGFNLIEVMTGSVVLGLALSSVLALASRAFGYLSDIRCTARSSQVLQQRMEDIRLMNWTQLQAVTNTFTDPSDASHRYAGSVIKTDYDWSANGSTTVMRVTLVVTWINHQGGVQTNSLSTLISNGGLNKYIL